MSNEKKTMTQRKSNKSVKTAVLLFGAVLLTTSLLGGTLAKYTGTIGEASDSARVAKWNVNEKMEPFDLFANSYVSKAGGNIPGTNEPVTVKGEGTTKVIAPGTQGEAIIKVDDTITASEVAYKYNFIIDAEDMDGTNPVTDVIPFYRNGNEKIPTTPTTAIKGWNVDKKASNSFDAWLPLEFKVTQGASTILYDGFTKGDDGAAQVKELRKALTSVESGVIYPQSTSADISNILKNSSVKIEWRWQFDRNKDDQDTQLGLNANGTGNEVPNFVIKIAAAKTQVD
ncbi:hypothetical protein [Candidatus Enterococcus ferrettii]|uniref:Uncharacterized protein n=1 Tax=Candidatus Enterococcus ferrettii TaxID=2815324 RepID=A0ABV0EIE3_9ENTE|nr:hypothetical protein [Enterococcus sp. 665A]MBO1341808.1 hypothetical protein [Enterococcus sp. 665A]